jgi:heme O synthase-like polyprenyltransferase
MTAAVTTRKATSLSPSLRDAFALAKPRITSMVLLTAAGGIWLSPGHISQAGRCSSRNSTFRRRLL